MKAEHSYYGAGSQRRKAQSTTYQSDSRSKRQVVILDCCFSGAFTEGLLAKDDGTVNIQEQVGGVVREGQSSHYPQGYILRVRGCLLQVAEKR